MLKCVRVCVFKSKQRRNKRSYKNANLPSSLKKKVNTVYS